MQYKHLKKELQHKNKQYEIAIHFQYIVFRVDKTIIYSYLRRANV